MPSLLLINQAFPPENTVAAHRVGNFAKYLDQAGWSIHVLARESQQNIARKPSWIDSITRLSLYPSKNPIFASDEFRWIYPLVKETKRLISENKFDVIFHSSPDFMPLTVILPVKRAVNIPYVIDLRDPWSVGPSFSGPGVKGSLYNTLTTFFEPKVFDKADSIVLNNQGMLNRYQDRYPTKVHSKFKVINNGFDHEEIEAVDSRESSTLDIVYPGKFYNDTRLFFRSLRDFCDGKSDVNFHHFGQIDRQYTELARRYVREFSLDDVVNFHGYQERSVVLSYLKGADLGLVMTRQNDPTHIPVKTYDYIGCNLPILSIDDEGSTEEVLSNRSFTEIVEYSDDEGIIEFLEFIYKNHRKARIPSNLQYSYEQLTQSLSTELATLID